MLCALTLMDGAPSACWKDFQRLLHWNAGLNKVYFAENCLDYFECAKICGRVLATAFATLDMRAPVSSIGIR
jgi:hypothetical protein